MRYIIDFKDSLSTQEINAYCGTNNITIIRQYAAFGNVFLCECAAAPAIDTQIESVVHDDPNGIQLLGIDITLTDSSETTNINLEDDKNWWKVASLNTVDFDEPNHTHIVRGHHSTAYILDSGIEISHPEFENADVTLLHSFTEEFSDTKGHGTGLASLISGKTCGLTAAKLKIVKVFDVNKPTLQSDLLHAFDAVLADYIANEKKPSVVNLSWGISKNEYINSKINILIDEGLYVVAASGNAGLPIGDVTPASIPRVLTTGAYNQNLQPCNFSNYTGESIVSLTENEVNNGALDGWAPGEQIWVAGLNGTYGYIAGTSASAAIASGALAYNFSKFTDDEGNGVGIYVNYSDRTNYLVENWKPKVNNPVSPEDDTPFYTIAISKPNMLDLSDPKYSASINRVVVYLAGAETSLGRNRMTAYAGRTTYRSVFSRITTARIVTNQPIPDYVTIDNTGMITVDAPDITDPYLDIPPIEFDLYQRDGSMGTLIVSILILRPDVNRDTVEQILPSSDPVVNMVLYYNCTGGCTNDCPGACGWSSPTKSCWCGG